jgi:hypothetical protein
MNRPPQNQPPRRSFPSPLGCVDALGAQSMNRQRVAAELLQKLDAGFGQLQKECSDLLSRTRDPLVIASTRKHFENASTQASRIRNALTFIASEGEQSLQKNLFSWLEGEVPAGIPDTVIGAAPPAAPTPRQNLRPARAPQAEAAPPPVKFSPDSIVSAYKKHAPSPAENPAPNGVAPSKPRIEEHPEEHPKDTA